MKWTTIDLGSSEVKAAVNDVANRPIKLTYHEGVSYSYMPSVALVSDDEIFIGRHVLLLDAIGAEGVVSNWNSHSQKDKITRSFFLAIKQAAKDFYSEDAIGAVLIFDDVSQKREVESDIEDIKKGKESNNSNIAKIATDVFSNVHCVCSSEVVTSIYSPNKDLSMVVDLGYSSLKISVVDNGIQKSYNRYPELGFGSVDLSEIVDYDFSADVSNTEHALSGMYLGEVVRRNLCLSTNNYYPLPIFKGISKGKNEIQKKFDMEIMRYLYKCFDSCDHILKNSKWGWNDLNSILFCGGAANFHLLSQVFEKYKASYGTDCTATVKTFSKDAQWVGAYSAIQLPLERNVSTVTVEY